MQLSSELSRHLVSVVSVVSIQSEKRRRATLEYATLSCTAANGGK
jgi:hypothetical protein